MGADDGGMGAGRAGAGAGMLGMAAMAAAAAVGAVTVTVAHADEAEHGLHAPSYPWPHNGIFSSYDHSAYVQGGMAWHGMHCATSLSCSLSLHTALHAELSLCVSAP